MQDLIVNNVYEGHLRDGPFAGARCLALYLGRDGDSCKKFRLLEELLFGMSPFGGDVVRWGVGEVVTLLDDDWWEFYPVYDIKENE